MLILEKIIENELKEANKRFPPFHSRHEAFAVMKEELEEAAAEFTDITTGVLEDYWTLCRDSKTIKHNAPEATNLLDCLEAAIICNLKELIQLGAMVKKSKDLEKSGGVKNENY